MPEEGGRREFFLWRGRVSEFEGSSGGKVKRP